MKAFHLKESAEGIRPILVDVPLPEPKNGEIRLRMEAASLNYRDLLALNDSAYHGKQRIPLSDGVGIVDAKGPGVTNVEVGERVAGCFFPNWLDGPFDYAYLESALGGSTTDGVLAEAVILPAHGVVPIPGHLTATQAATLPCAAVTAWQALIARGRMSAEDILLIQGTGGVAIFALQIAAALGARSILLSSSDAKLERAAAMGATHGVNYSKTPDWNKTVMELTGGRGASHILELGGPDTFGRSLASVAASGRIAQIGVLTGFGPKENLLSLQFANATIDGICVGSRKHFRDLNDFISKHKILPVIDRSFAFYQAEEAFVYMKSSDYFGKIVIEF